MDRIQKISSIPRHITPGRRLMEFAEDWTKAYGLIYRTYCTSEMKAAIKEHPDFKIEIRDEPIK